MTVEFTPPRVAPDPNVITWHGHAVAGNKREAQRAMEILRDALPLDGPHERILLRAAAGAGKSHTLKYMVQEALKEPMCGRVAITAFANKQIYPLAADLGDVLGKDNVCLFAAKDRMGEIAPSIKDRVTTVCEYRDVPQTAQVVVATTHKFEYTTRYLKQHLGLAADKERLFDVLFVDEAWQLALHRYAKVSNIARVVVGVGDVGQLPPLDRGNNPWRGDPGYNPYRAWPTAYEEDAVTWATELPAVWRPTFQQLELWRAFYADWDDLNCVAGPADRTVNLDAPHDVWSAIATGVPTLLEVDGLAEPEAPDVDLPLLSVVEQLLDDLLTAGFTVRSQRYDDDGSPSEQVEVVLDKPGADPLIAVLATRNQAVQDAEAMVARLQEKHDLAPNVLVASTVDSWQGQTNALTVALHPLSGASQLDEFNSAFGRLAVTCTRATHGLLLLARAGLDELLDNAPARPGTPFGEPGNRQLPRQTHQRILGAFQRGRLDLTEGANP